MIAGSYYYRGGALCELFQELSKGHLSANLKEEVKSLKTGNEFREREAPEGPSFGAPSGASRRDQRVRTNFNITTTLHRHADQHEYQA
jgi:hypothetical protein